MAEQAWTVAWDVKNFLKLHPLSFPKKIATSLGFTRAEVELALWYWDVNARRRGDGRWYWEKEE